MNAYLITFTDDTKEKVEANYYKTDREDGLFSFYEGTWQIPNKKILEVPIDSVKSVRLLPRYLKGLGDAYAVRLARLILKKVNWSHYINSLKNADTIDRGITSKEEIEQEQMNILTELIFRFNRRLNSE